MVLGAIAVSILPMLTLASSLSAQDWGTDHERHFSQFYPGNLVVSRTVYDNLATNVTVGEQLPPNCTTGNCVSAVADGTFPYIFNNAPVDGSFGITSRIFLDQITPWGFPISTLEVPNSMMHHITGTSDQLVGSFSSKSELALHLSTDNNYLTFMGYVAPVNALDVSNSNTPGVVDSTNPVPNSYYRAVARMDRWGHIDFTETNAYSGNNGRSAILNNTSGNPIFYTAGNAGNGSNPQPDGVVLGAGSAVHSLRGSERGNAGPRRAHTAWQLQRYVARRQSRQGRQGRQLPRHYGLQQRGLLHQGQRRQRREHRLLCRHHRHSLPQGNRSAVGFCDASHRAAQLYNSASVYRSAEQHVHPRRLSDELGEDGHAVPLQPVVCQRHNALRCR